jgi:hypothetical protein
MPPGGRVRIAKLLAIAALLIALPALSHSQPTPAKPPEAAGSLPKDWDAHIPLPKGAVLTSSTVPKTGVVYSATFSAPGTYEELVDFYEKQIPKSGFMLGPKVAFPARKVYNRSFSKKSILDSVVITPSADDPSKFVLSITYTPVSGKPVKGDPQ